MDRYTLWRWRGRLFLFGAIVFRTWHDVRLWPRTAWRVVMIVYEPGCRPLGARDA